MSRCGADDQLVTTYRGLHDLIGKGVPLEEIYGEMMGRTVGASRGKGGTMHIAKPEKGVMLSTGIVGAGPPVAVGLAMAGQAQGARPRHGGQLRRRRDQHRLVPRGGEHGRAVGSADGVRLPEQPVRRDDADHGHDEARARRRPGRRLRHAGCSRRRQRPAGGRRRRSTRRCGRARGGDGPTFIECVTFRFRGHYFGDRMPYIPKEQLEAAMAADPVPRFRAHLIDAGICTDDELERHRRRRADRRSRQR